MPLGSRNDERAQPFVSGKGALGVVLLHGLTGTPHDVRQFAEAFAGRGFVVVAPRLAGHEDPTKLEASSWHDWYDSAQDALDECRSRGAERVAVIGFSMGGLVALRLGALRNHQVTALATLAAPLTVRPWQRVAIHTLAGLRRSWPVGKLVGMLPKEGPDVRVRRAFDTSPTMRVMPYPSLNQLLDLQAEVQGLLPQVRQPLLILHGRFDHTAAIEDSVRLSQAVGSRKVRRIVLPNSFHIVGLDVDRDQATEALLAFALEELGIPSVPCGLP